MKKIFQTWQRCILLSQWARSTVAFSNVFKRTHWHSRMQRCHIWNFFSYFLFRNIPKGRIEPSLRHIQRVLYTPQHAAEIRPLDAIKSCARAQALPHSVPLLLLLHTFVRSSGVWLLPAVLWSRAREGIWESIPARVLQCKCHRASAHTAASRPFVAVAQRGYCRCRSRSCVLILRRYIRYMGKFTELLTFDISIIKKK